MEFAQVLGTRPCDSCIYVDINNFFNIICTIIIFDRDYTSELLSYTCAKSAALMSGRTYLRKFYNLPLFKIVSGKKNSGKSLQYAHYNNFVIKGNSNLSQPLHMYSGEAPK